MSKRYFLLKGPVPFTERPGVLRVEAVPWPGLAVAGAPEETPVSEIISSLPDKSFLLGELQPARGGNRDIVEASAAAALLLAGCGIYFLPGVRSDIRAFFALLVFTPLITLSAIWTFAEGLRSMAHRAFYPPVLRSAASLTTFGFAVAGIVMDRQDLADFMIPAGILAAVRPLTELLPRFSRLTCFRSVKPLGGGYSVKVLTPSGETRSVPIGAVSEGDVVSLEQGDMVPLECVVVEGEAEISYGGLPVPGPAGPGTALHPGAEVTGGPLKAAVVKVPDINLAEASTRIRILLRRNAPPAPVMNLVAVTAVTTFLVSLTAKSRFAGMEWTYALLLSAVVMGVCPLEAPSLLFSLYRRLLADLAASFGLQGPEEDCAAAAETTLLELKSASASPPPGLKLRVREDIPGDMLGYAETRNNRTIFLLPPSSGNRMEGITVLGADPDHFLGFVSRAGELRRRLIASMLFALGAGTAAAAAAAVGFLNPLYGMALSFLATLWAVGMLSRNPS